MKMYLRHRHLVRRAFRLGDQLIYIDYVLFDFFRRGKMPADDVLDVRQAAVRMGVAAAVVVRMGVVAAVVVAMLLCAANLHGKMRAADAALKRTLAADRNARQAEAVHFPDKSVRLRRQLQQRGRQHVARRTHAQVEI